MFGLVQGFSFSQDHVGRLDFAFFGRGSLLVGFFVGQLQIEFFFVGTLLDFAFVSLFGLLLVEFLCLFLDDSGPSLDFFVPVLVLLQVGVEVVRVSFLYVVAVLFSLQLVCCGQRFGVAVHFCQRSDDAVCDVWLVLSGFDEWFVSRDVSGSCGSLGSSCAVSRLLVSGFCDLVGDYFSVLDSVRVGSPLSVRRVAWRLAAEDRAGVGGVSVLLVLFAFEELGTDASVAVRFAAIKGKTTRCDLKTFVIFLD